MTPEELREFDKRWNAALDAMVLVLNTPIDSKLRGQLREEGCCNEFDQVRNNLLHHIKDIRS